MNHGYIGQRNGKASATVEVYDPINDVIHNTSSLTTARWGFTSSIYKKPNSNNAIFEVLIFQGANSLGYVLTNERMLINIYPSNYPTSSPSNSPFLPPSNSPTSTPSNIPFSNPTNSPTVPSFSPTNAPTIFSVDHISQFYYSNWTTLATKLPCKYADFWKYGWALCASTDNIASVSSKNTSSALPLRLFHQNSTYDFHFKSGTFADGPYLKNLDYAFGCQGQSYVLLNNITYMSSMDFTNTYLYSIGPDNKMSVLDGKFQRSVECRLVLFLFSHGLIPSTRAPYLFVLSLVTTDGERYVYILGGFPYGGSTSEFSRSTQKYDTQTGEFSNGPEMRHRR